MPGDLRLENTEFVPLRSPQAQFSKDLALARLRSARSFWRVHHKRTGWKYEDWAAPILQRPLEVKDGFAIPQKEAGCGIAWDEDAEAGARLTAYRNDYLAVARTES
jgi:hypothetical protein